MDKELEELNKSDEAGLKRRAEASRGVYTTVIAMAIFVILFVSFGAYVKCREVASRASSPVTATPLDNISRGNELHVSRELRPKATPVVRGVPVQEV